MAKRIIDGKTYNTETATRIAGWDDPWDRDDGPFPCSRYLYQTRFGAFFLHVYGEAEGEDIVPFTPEQAREWLEKNQPYRPELIEFLFGQMPEAGSGEIKFTLRLPESLRDRLAACAKAKEQSLNAWIVRCLESCAAADFPSVAGEAREIPQMGNMVRGSDGTWRPKGT